MEFSPKNFSVFPVFNFCETTRQLGPEGLPKKAASAKNVFSRNLSRIIMLKIHDNHEKVSLVRFSPTKLFKKKYRENEF